MNRTPDVALVLRDYFADDGASAPDYVLDAVEERIGRQPQRRALRLPWRPNPMNRTITYAAALAAVLVVAFVGYNLLPRQPSTSGSTTAPSTAPTSIATPAATPSTVPPSAAATPPPFPCEGATKCLGPLAAGTYEAKLIVPLRYTVPEGWQNMYFKEKGFAVQPVGSTKSDALMVFIDPLAASQSSCERDREPGVGTTADELVAWLVAHPGLTVTGPNPASVGGLDGQALDYQRAEVVPPPCASSANLFTHDPPDDFWWSISSSVKNHAVLLDAGSHTVLVLVEAPITRFDAVMAAAQPIIDTFVLTPVP